MKYLARNKRGILTILLANLILAGCVTVATPTPAAQQSVPLTPTQPATMPPAPVGQAIIAETVPVEPKAEIEPVVSTTFVEWAPAGPMVEGAESTLVRMEHGLYATFNAVELNPGDAFTMWWVIFNKPENCSDGECGIDDVFLVDENGERLKTSEGAPRPNLPGRAATECSQLTATGTIVDEDGTAKFIARLPVGDTNEAQFGPGLLNPMDADVHLVIRTHGPATPGVLHEQMTTEWGGCPEGYPKTPCGNVQLAIHQPRGQ